MPQTEALRLHTIAQAIRNSSQFLDDDIDSALEAFRSLRNNCVGNVEYQTTCAADEFLLIDTHYIMTALLNKHDDDNAVLCNRVAAQFLGNLIVGHNENQFIVWDQFSSILKKLLAVDDAKLKNFSSMILYNILLGQPELRNPKPNGTDLLIAVLQNAVMDCEFAVFIVELFLSTQDVLEESYPFLSIECRLRLLEIGHEMLLTMTDTAVKVEDKKKKEATKSDVHRRIPLSSIKFMVEQLKRRSFLILKTSAHYADTLEPREVSKLIEVVACASCKDPYMAELQSDKSLLIDCTFLLKSIHMAGQSGEADFVPVTKLSEMNLNSKGSDSDLEQHPAFGFKACLVRLLGNLCWRHKENQDQVRELEGIQLLLDCCSIDARNPLMIQWVVLAVRNLCENNKENQAVIAGLSREGTVDSRMLHELGFTLQSDEKSNKVRIVPLKNK